MDCPCYGAAFQRLRCPRLKAVAESLLKRLVQRLNIVPEPHMQTPMAFSMARPVMTGVKLELFAAVATAAPCGKHHRTTEKVHKALSASLARRIDSGLRRPRGIRTNA